VSDERKQQDAVVAELTQLVADLQSEVEPLRRDNARLQREEQWFRALIEQAAEMLLVLSEDGNMLYVSPSLTRLLAYDADDLLGRSAFEYIHPDERDEVLAAFSRTVHGGDRGESVELRIRHRNGTWRYHEAIGTNLLGNEALSGVVVNFRDIHRRKATEEALSN